MPPGSEGKYGENEGDGPLQRARPQVGAVPASETTVIEHGLGLYIQKAFEVRVQPSKKDDGDEKHGQANKPCPAPWFDIRGANDVPGKRQQRNRAGEVQIVGDGSGDEALPDIAQRALSNRHDDGGIKQESALPKKQGRHDEESTQKHHC
jgi:hypothetical protein